MLIASALVSLFIAFNLKFQAGFKSYKTFWQEIATEMPSTTETETYAFMDVVPAMREWIGERVFNGLVTRAYRLTNGEYENSITVPKKKIEDATIGIFLPSVASLGKQAAKLPDDLLAKVILEGTTASYWDGQNFFDEDHPINMDDPNSDVQPNLFFSCALTSDNFSKVRAAMKLQKDRSGHFIGVGDDLILVVPPQLESQAKLIVQAEYVPSAAGTASQTNPNKGMARVVVINEIGADANKDDWYLFDVGGVIKPFIFQSRTETEFTQQTDPSSESVFLKREFRYGAERRCAAGYGLHWYAAKAVKAAS